MDKLGDVHPPDRARGVHRADHKPTPHQEFHGLNGVAVSLFFSPQRGERSDALLRDSIGHGEGYALFFGHTRRRVPVFNGSADNVHAKLFQLVHGSLIGGQLHPAVWSPLATVEEEGEVASGGLVGECDTRAVCQVQLDFREAVALQQSFGHGGSPCGSR